MSSATTAVRAPLRDGRVVTIRPVERSDEAALRALHTNLSDSSRYLRFFTFGKTTAETFVHQLVSSAGQPGQGGLVAELDGEAVAVASYAALADPTVADIAFAVTDTLQSQGVGTLLFEHLVSLARTRGVRWFTATVLPGNTRMLRLFSDTGLPVRTRHVSGEVLADIRLDVDDAYLDAIAEREIVADVASLRLLLHPASVAVIGASRRPDAVGHAVLRNLVAGEFSGKLYPVNPHADSVLGLTTYRSVADLPEVPELAVVCVPARRVPEVAEQCGQRGIKALAVLSAGITGEPGLEQRLRQAVREHGMRMVGPNCLGIAACSADYTLDATFARTIPPHGPVGIVSQSGGVGIALLEQFARIGLGVSTVVSTGDKYDVSSNDLLMWWERDQQTRLAVLYLESFGNPRKFARIARRLGHLKPVLAVRSGDSEVAQRAAASHTAASATPAVTRDALFRQAGVITVDGLTDMLATAAVLTCQPLPGGPRVAVISNAGGAGVLAADACAAAGLELPGLAPATREALSKLLPGTASLVNPVDSTAGVSSETFTACVRAVLADPNVDGVVAISAPTALADLGPAVADAAANATKPLLAVRLDQGNSVDLVPLQDGSRMPACADPAVAVGAYARAVQYAAWRGAPRGHAPELSGIDIEAGRRVVSAVLDREPDGGWLEPDETAALLASFGVPVAESVKVDGPDAAVAAAERLGMPVALKAVVPGLLHKSDRGGVLLDIDGADAVSAGYATLQARFGAALREVVVQPMARPGVETLVGVVSDAVFGPLVVFGAGGVVTDLLGDRSTRLAPLTDADAAAMVRELRSSPLLFGYRGTPPSDHAAVEAVLLRVGALAEALPEVAELELNPLVVYPSGCVGVDARARIVPRTPVDPYLRRLR